MISRSLFSTGLMRSALLAATIGMTGCGGDGAVPDDPNQRTQVKPPIELPATTQDAGAQKPAAR
jgi:hypothetical protein